MKDEVVSMAKFSIGRLYLTNGVNDACKSTQFAEFLCRSMSRYIACDWGELCEDDKMSNDEAVVSGDDRIFAAYKYDDEHPDWKIWIITEWDRSVTTILFPREY